MYVCMYMLVLRCGFIDVGIIRVRRSCRCVYRRSRVASARFSAAAGVSLGSISFAGDFFPWRERGLAG